MQIPVYGGVFAIVDDDVLPLIGGRKWRFTRSAGRPTAVVSGRHGAGTFVMLHRLILQAPSGAIVDHINGDILDNRRCNLRLCTHAQNMRNRRISKANKTGFKGVYEQRGVYVAEIRCDGTKFRLGTFGTAERAHQAYARAAKIFHGEFARTA